MNAIIIIINTSEKEQFKVIPKLRLSIKIHTSCSIKEIDLKYVVV